jgi:ABC-2 type transport system ATP-binding protein
MQQPAPMTEVHPDADGHGEARRSPTGGIPSRTRKTPRRASPRRGGAALAGLLLAGAVVTGSSAVSADPAAGAATAKAWRVPACHRPIASPVQAVPVPGVPSDWTITSFDGTKIRAHWFPLAGASRQHPAPTLFMGPGWSMAGATEANSSDILGGLSIPALHAAGYNVLTWDPRGFGQSTGEAEVDSPNYEARDVSRLIDWVATLPGVELDRPGDPRMGMVGGSYGGGIQWVTAAEDCRVDAIVPTISWNSLVTSLGKADTFKSGWGTILTNLAATDSLDPHIRSAEAQGNATGRISAANQKWFAARGPGDLVKKIRIPTLIVQGTVDTLFTLDEAVTNYAMLKADGVPVSMLWYCGGHGNCLTSQGDPNAVTNATIAWINRWVKDDTSVATGPPIDIIDQNGVRYAAASYPIPTTTPLTARGKGTLALVATGGAGPITLPKGVADPLAGIALAIQPARAANAVNLRVNAGSRTSLVVGAPRLTITYQGTVPPGVRPTRVFAQLVDNTTGFVLGNQITPIDVVLDGRRHTTSVPLEIVSQSMAPGQSVTLQLVATTVAYALPRLGGSVTFRRITISLPVVKRSAVSELRASSS